jgi:hypothetical protein
MKLLVVSQYFWPENFIISDFVCKLAERGHTVVVATGKPNYPDGQVFPGYRAGGTVRESFLGKVDVVRVPIWPRGRGARAWALDQFVIEKSAAAVLRIYERLKSRSEVR